MSRRIVILTEGHSNPHTAKTACSVLRYRPDEVVAVLDSTQAGNPVRDLLGVAHQLVFISSLQEAPEANTLLIGIAPPGGKMPEAWRAVVREALDRGMTIWSGLHEFLSDDPEFQALAAAHGGELIDVRKNQFREISRLAPLRDGCLRILTVGHDCSVGKMVTAIEMTSGLKQRGYDAKFVATGQTGIMVEGDGLPIDCVVADFVSGAAERLVLDHQHHDFLLVEGQGSLVHPSYSGVTLGILHGSVPHGLVLCYEVGRKTITGIPHMEIPPLATIKQLNETMASVMQACRVIGISMNSRRVDEAAAERERERVRKEFGLPVCDVFRHGSQPLVEAALRLRQELLGETA